jgi:putative glutamine amidotransferase
MTSRPTTRDFNVTSTLAHGIRESSSDVATIKRAHTVAVTATSDTRLGGVHRVRLNSAYITALELAGLVPIVIPPLSSPAAARSIIAAVDALVLTGGEDVDPDLYGQQRNEHSGPANRLRDQTEIALVLAAREARKPVLAICRGPQILNVALGGTLIQDIPSCVPDAVPHNADDARDERTHDVIIEPGSLIAAAVGGTRISVNSLHHQSILDPAPGLKVTARAPDGIIEGVESETPGWWAMAVQWHPEEMTESPEPWDRGIFRALAMRLDEG